MHEAQGQGSPPPPAQDGWDASLPADRSQALTQNGQAGWSCPQNSSPPRSPGHSHGHRLGQAASQWTPFALVQHVSVLPPFWCHGGAASHIPAEEAQRVCAHACFKKQDSVQWLLPTPVPLEGARTEPTGHPAISKKSPRALVKPQQHCLRYFYNFTQVQTGTRTKAGLPVTLPGPFYGLGTMRAFGRKEELTKGSRNYVSINSNQVYLSTRKGKNQLYSESLA